MSTAYHSKYFACELTRRWSSERMEKLSQSLFNATVDLNPHQLDAALFAFRSPLSRGAILADEVGLGKTIEAGLIVSQLWAERKRRILVIAPTILRKQWAQELAEKFYIPSVIVDSREFNARRKADQANPFQCDNLVAIVSYQFARSKEAELAAVRWDLVVIDEAHRLRNVYKASNKISNAIKRAVSDRPVLLLTATPLQNSLLELYGLVSLIDEHMFGDVKAFRARYMRGAADDRQLKELSQRLRPICKRTLRRQVTEYVRFTNRLPITEDFTPTPEEQQLYEKVSEYLQREKLVALPTGQRKLMTLVLRKLLASSTFAIAGTLEALAERLEAMLAAAAADNASEMVEEDFETFGEMSEEWAEAEEPEDAEDTADLEEIKAELNEVKAYGALAASIVINAKGDALLKALRQGSETLASLGAARKAVIFTESRRTQTYLFNLLAREGFAGRVLTINGTNSDDQSGMIYKAWVQRHRGEPILTGNKTVDLRAAIVEHFRDHADILIATEAAAEGVNLQFCSLVVNYDLPWNPQRIEQRIGRCHRYGQQHDVVVINFLNRANAADRRVFELLSEKFKLFDGVFGSSDEVLGALESGVDFERRIAEIYQSCRSPEAIDAAFKLLRDELEEQIAARMADTRRALLEHFDEEVHQRLKTSLTESRVCLDRMEKALWAVTRYELNGAAEFDEENYEFTLKTWTADWPEVPTGRYQFATRTREVDGHYPYRIGHPLAEAALKRAEERDLPVCEIVFDYSNRANKTKIGLVESQRNRAGWLAVQRLTVTALDNEEDHLLCAALDDAGQPLHPEFCEKLFQVPGQAAGVVQPPAEIHETLQRDLNASKLRLLDEIANRNNRFFDDEMDKLERWADDLKYSLEAELKDLDALIKQTRKESKLAGDLTSKLDLQRKVKDLESERAQKRRQLYEAQDEIDAQKETLISGVEAKLQQTVSTTELFMIRWKIV